MNSETITPAQDLLSHTLAYCDECLNRQDFSAAWQALCQAVNLAPNRADVLSHRGRLALLIKDSETAQRDFAQALKIDPGCAAAWAGLARYHWQQSALGEAEAAVTRALSIDPADEDAIQLKAEIYGARLNEQARKPSNLNFADQIAVEANRRPTADNVQMDENRPGALLQGHQPEVLFGIGFYPEEVDWHWLDHEGELLFHLTRASEIEFLLQCSAIDCYPVHPFEVSVWLGKELKWKADFQSSNQEHLVKFTLEAPSSTTRVRLVSHCAMVPKEHGVNEDKRRLSVCLSRLAIHPLAGT